MIATRSTTVTLSKEAIRVLDLHRLAELNERLHNLATLHQTIERDIKLALEERDALTRLVRP